MGGLWLLWCSLPGPGVGRHFLGNTRPPWFRLVIDLSWQSGAAFHSPFLSLFSTVFLFLSGLLLSLFLSAQRAGCITVGWNVTIGPGLLYSSFWLPLALFACLRHVYAVRTTCLSTSFGSDKKKQASYGLQLLKYGVLLSNIWILKPHWNVYILHLHLHLVI